MNNSMQAFMWMFAIVSVTCLLAFKIYKVITNETSNISIPQRVAAVNMFSAVMTIFIFANLKPYIMFWLQSDRHLVPVFECGFILVVFFIARFVVLRKRTYKEKVIEYELQKLKALMLNTSKILFMGAILVLGIYVACYVAYYAFAAYVTFLIFSFVMISLFT